MKGGFGCSCCGNGGVECVVTGPEGYDVLSNTAWGAQQFITPAGGLTLSSATVYLDAGQTLTDATKAKLKLYSNVVNFGVHFPNALLHTFDAPGSVSTEMTFTLPDEPLTGSTEYWLVLHVLATSAPQKTLRWNYMFEGEGCVLSLQSYSADGGGNWFPPNIGTPYKYTIN